MICKVKWSNSLGLLSGFLLVSISLLDANADVGTGRGPSFPNDDSCDGYRRIYAEGPQDGFVCTVYEPYFYFEARDGTACFKSDVVCSSDSRTINSFCYEGPDQCWKIQDGVQVPNLEEQESAKPDLSLGNVGLF